MTSPDPIVFLLDVDNTLLDNDRVVADLRRHLDHEIGADDAERYWATLESRRTELGYVDYLDALQINRSNAESEGRDDPGLLQVSDFLIDYPFAERLYPQALEAIENLSDFGRTVILSDGDAVVQPRKVRRSGLWDAVCGRVLVYIHKERMLTSLQRHYPARHYIMLDDKLRILAAMKEQMQDRLTTVFVRQGHYALDPANIATHPAAQGIVERIGDLAGCDPCTWLGNLDSSIEANDS